MPSAPGPRAPGPMHPIGGWFLGGGGGSGTLGVAPSPTPTLFPFPSKFSPQVLLGTDLGGVPGLVPILVREAALAENMRLLPDAGEHWNS